MTEKTAEKDASRQAANFRRVREAHQTEVAEDYVELIGDLIEQNGEARVVDLANRLGVTNATVNGTIQRLVRDGLVTSEPYRSIFLTAEGAKLAAATRERHEVVDDPVVELVEGFRLLVPLVIAGHVVHVARTGVHAGAQTHEWRVANQIQCPYRREFALTGTEPDDTNRGLAHL